jgi:hypothetical protein
MDRQRAARDADIEKRVYLHFQYHRLAARLGAKRAILAVAHTILVIIYHLLRHGATYQDLGDSYFDKRDHQGTLRRSVRRLEGLGYKVTPEAAGESYFRSNYDQHSWNLRSVVLQTWSGFIESPPK